MARVGLTVINCDVCRVIHTAGRQVGFCLENKLLSLLGCLIREARRLKASKSFEVIPSFIAFNTRIMDILWKLYAKYC